MCRRPDLDCSAELWAHRRHCLCLPACRDRSSCRVPKGEDEPLAVQLYRWRSVRGRNAATCPLSFTAKAPASTPPSVPNPALPSCDRNARLSVGLKNGETGSGIPLSDNPTTCPRLLRAAAALKSSCPRMIGRQSSILVDPLSELHHQCVA
jgi:hypothetical protein